MIVLGVRKILSESLEDNYSEIIRKSRLEIFNQEPIAFANVNGLNIRYAFIYTKRKTLANAKTIVLIHGIGASIYCWRHMVYELAKSYNVLVFDLPGFGFSDKPADAEYGLDAQSERVINFLDTLGLKKFYLVGHSLGGVIAAWIAKKYPERVEKLSLLAPGFSHKLKLVQPDQIMWFVNGAQKYLTRPGLIKFIYRRAMTKGIPDVGDLPLDMSYIPFHNSPETVVAVVKSNTLLNDSRINTDLKSLQVPIQIIYGDKDQVIIHKAIKQFMKANPHAECLVLKGSGHLLIEEDAQLVSEKITQFLDKK